MYLPICPSLSIVVLKSLILKNPLIQINIKYDLLTQKSPKLQFGEHVCHFYANFRIIPKGS